MKCQRCDNQSVKGGRFCGGCRKEVIREMKESGYLQRKPFWRQPMRSQDQREVIRETKFGRD